MTIYKPSLVSGDRIPLAVTNPRHLVPVKGDFSVGGKVLQGRGAVISELERMTGSESVIRAGSFDDAMLRALDRVSGVQQNAGDLARRAITDPGSVDVHDITIAQAEAEMALNITRTILNRVVQGWRDLINTR
ncbi:MAG: flagellar hook-basal body complex protein FliE [Spirochaetaceae bacterium]|nr:flagellar hook-basal body complex protein FliE [Spirochaetaceae bacterium]